MLDISVPLQLVVGKERNPCDKRRCASLSIFWSISNRKVKDGHSVYIIMKGFFSLILGWIQSRINVFECDPQTRRSLQSLNSWQTLADIWTHHRGNLKSHCLSVWILLLFSICVHFTVIIALTFTKLSRSHHIRDIKLKMDIVTATSRIALCRPGVKTWPPLPSLCYVIKDEWSDRETEGLSVSQ